MPVDIEIVETTEPPVYQRIAAKATHLHELGMTYLEISKKLGVDRWTAGKAVRWAKSQRKPPPCVVIETENPPNS